MGDGRGAHAGGIKWVFAKAQDIGSDMHRNKRMEVRRSRRHPKMKDAQFEALGQFEAPQSERLKGVLKDPNEARDHKEQGPCNRGAQRRAHGGAGEAPLVHERCKVVGRTRVRGGACMEAHGLAPVQINTVRDEGRTVFKKTKNNAAIRVCAQLRMEARESDKSGNMTKDRTCC
jgi:hypothetical protein